MKAQLFFRVERFVRNGFDELERVPGQRDEVGIPRGCPLRFPGRCRHGGQPGKQVADAARIGPREVGQWLVRFPFLMRRDEKEQDLAIAAQPCRARRSQGGRPFDQPGPLALDHDLRLVGSAVGPVVRYPLGLVQTKQAVHTGLLQRHDVPQMLPQRRGVRLNRLRLAAVIPPGNLVGCTGRRSPTQEHPRRGPRRR